MGENEDLVRQLAEALKPFAEAGRHVSRIGGKWDEDAWIEAVKKLNVGHFQDAVEAIARANEALKRPV